MRARGTGEGVARRGVALVAVLWVVVIAGLLLIGVRRTVYVDLAMARNEVAVVQAHWLARAGVEQALALLDADDAGTDSHEDWWHDDPVSFEAIELSVGRFTVAAGPTGQDDATGTRFGLVDHTARVNVNTADGKQLEALADLTEEQVDAILDWRDKDDDVRPAGAERAHYDRRRYPHLMRNAALKTLDELRLVADVDAPAFFGEDANRNGVLDANEDDGAAGWPDDDADGRLKRGLAGLTTVYSYELNKDAYGNERVNVAKASKGQLKEKLKFADALADAVVKLQQQKKLKKLTDLLNAKPKKGAGKSSSRDGAEQVSQITLKWLAENMDRITTSEEKRLPGKINVNTAPREVLTSLPEIDEEAADAIEARRGSSQGALEGVGQLLTDDVLTEKQFKAVAELLTVRSTVFEIRSRGTTTTGLRQEIVAIVDRGQRPAKVLYWVQSE